jgi:hypothetical protein
MNGKKDELNPVTFGATSAPAAGAANAPQRQPMTVRFIDRPDCMETYADSIAAMAFDGQSLRIDFAVTRMDEVKPNTPISGRRYPTCRLVLPPAAAVELINKMQQIGAALAQAGVMKATPAAAATGKDDAKREQARTVRPPDLT